MSSNRNLTASPTLIDNLLYTKGTSQVLNVPENEMVSITMYPNPTSDYLNIKGLTNETTFKIIDSLGRTIESGSVTLTANDINVNSLSKGVYFLMLNGYESRTFIKK